MARRKGHRSKSSRHGGKGKHKALALMGRHKKRHSRRGKRKK